MHASFQERIDELGALLILTRQARGAFKRRMSDPTPRYQVVTKAPQAFHIVEVETGKTRGFRFSYAAALDWALQLEAKAQRSLPGGAQ